MLIYTHNDRRIEIFFQCNHLNDPAKLLLRRIYLSSGDHPSIKSRMIAIISVAAAIKTIQFRNFFVIQRNHVLSLRRIAAKGQYESNHMKIVNVRFAIRPHNLRFFNGRGPRHHLFSRINVHADHLARFLRAQRITSQESPQSFPHSGSKAKTPSQNPLPSSRYYPVAHHTRSAHSGFRSIRRARSARWYSRN